MTTGTRSFTPEELAILAARLADKWAIDRCTQAQPAERDLARWVLEWLSARVDLAGAVELQGPLAALES